MYKDEKFWDRIASKFDRIEQNKTEISYIFMHFRKAIIIGKGLSDKKSPAIYCRMVWADLTETNLKRLKYENSQFSVLTVLDKKN